MCYVKEKRADYKAKHPNLGFGDLSKKIAEAWKKLSSEEKVPFEELHAKDKARYEEDMKGYTKPESDSESESEEEKKKKTGQEEGEEGPGWTEEKYELVFVLY